MALQLRKLGIKEVHPLVGGWHKWKENGYPLEMPRESVKQAVG